MKKFLLLIATVLAFSGCTPAPDFHVSLIYVDAEQSEDSNSTTETLQIDGYKGSYHWVYDGYTPNDDWDTDREYSFKLTEEDLQSLTLLIRENGLMVDREETVSTGEPWSAFDVQWSMEMGGQSAEGHVVGEAIAWEDWDSTGHDSFAEDEALWAADSVFDFVREKVGFEY